MTVAIHAKTTYVACRSLSNPPERSTVARMIFGAVEADNPEGGVHVSLNLTSRPLSVLFESIIKMIPHQHSIPVVCVDYCGEGFGREYCEIRSQITKSFARPSDAKSPSVRDPGSPVPAAHSSAFRIPHAKRAGALLLSAVVHCVQTAEREGFEPSVQFYPDNTLAPCPIRPLWHLSKQRQINTNYGLFLSRNERILMW
jgi:hypothetical protein